MRCSRRWSLIAIGMVAACSSAGDEAAPTTASTTTSSTTTSSTAAPTTTTTTSTDGAPDRSPPASTPPGEGTAVVVSSLGVLGWWDGQSWVPYAQGTAVPVVGGETYAVVQVGAPLRMTEGSVLDPGCGEFAFEGNPAVDVDLGPEPTWPAVAPVAVSGVRSPVPRPVTSIATAAYQVAAEEVAEDAGYEADGTEVAQAVRADLDGDGGDEVVVVAERLTGRSAFESVPGDHSVVFLRAPTGDGSVRTEVLTTDVNESTPDAPSPYLVSSRVAAVADLNGDGRMEVVLAQRYYEGSLTLVFEVGASGAAAEVLFIGCGA